MAKISDERRRLLIQAIAEQVLDGKLAAFQKRTSVEVASVAQQQTALITDLQAIVAQQQAMIAELSARKYAVELGNAPHISVGSLVAISTAATKRWVLPLAGVKPNDILRAQPDEYLPDGYGLPQAICRNAGQIEIRIAVPTLALGTTKTITLAITALR